MQSICNWMQTNNGKESTSKCYLGMSTWVLSTILHTTRLDGKEDLGPIGTVQFIIDAAWAVCSIHHTAYCSYPESVVYRWDMLFNYPYLAYRKALGCKCQLFVNAANAKENAKCINKGKHHKARDKYLAFPYYTRTCKWNRKNSVWPHKWTCKCYKTNTLLQVERMASTTRGIPQYLDDGENLCLKSWGCIVVFMCYSVFRCIWNKLRPLFLWTFLFFLSPTLHKTTTLPCGKWMS